MTAGGSPGLRRWAQPCRCRPRAGLPQGVSPLEGVAREAVTSLSGEWAFPGLLERDGPESKLR